MNADHAKKISIMAISHIPILVCALMTTHVGLLMCGKELLNADLMNTFIGYSTVSSIMLFLCSYALRFCCLHRLFIVYNELVSDCIGLQQMGMLTPILFPLRLFVFLSGLSLSSLRTKQWISLQNL